MVKSYIIGLLHKPWEGKTIKMTLEMKNDTITQTYPVDEKVKWIKTGLPLKSMYSSKSS